MTCSSQVNHWCSTPSSGTSAPAGCCTGTSRGSESGTLTRAKRSSPLASRRSTPRLWLMLEMCGNGRPGSNASGVSTGNTLLLVVLAERGLLRGVQVGVVDDVDAGGLELGPELAEALARRLHDAPGALLRQREQLLRRVAVGRRLGDAGLDLLPQAGDAHHEELAEDRADDADELDALDERVVGVAGLVQHAVEEVEHAELAVDVERGVAQVRVGELGLGLELAGELLLCCPGGGLDGLPPVVLVRARPVLGPSLRTSSRAGAQLHAPAADVVSGDYRPDLTVYAQIVTPAAPRARPARRNGGGRRSPEGEPAGRRRTAGSLRTPCSRRARRRAPRS